MMEKCFLALSQQANWASARDVGTVGGKVFARALKSQVKTGHSQLVVSEADVETELNSMIAERESRSSFSDQPTSADDFLVKIAPLLTQDLKGPETQTANKIGEDQNQETPPESQPPTLWSQELADIKEAMNAQRDAGVSDRVWEQLQRDKQAELDQEEEFLRLQQAKNTASGEARDKILKRLLEEECQRKQEEEMRRKLEMLGRCPMGFRWIKQTGGYRCAGGSHFLSDDLLDLGH